jgi:hypothetical protein
MMLIAVTLCLLLIVTAGAGMAAPPQKENINAGNTAQFDVTLYSNIVGKIIVNTRQQTFVFNGKGHTPGREYFLV